MESFTEDLWGIILARLPLRSITSSKLVCKQWKSIVESPVFRQLFLSHHQNSHSSWSLIYKHWPVEVVAHYGCAIWGLTRSLGSYLSSFLSKTFETHNEKVRVLAYTNVGLILIGLGSDLKNPTYYVANPISQQCVKIPPRPLRPLGQQEECFRPGLVTRIEKDVLLSYKIVLMDRTNIRTESSPVALYDLHRSHYLERKHLLDGRQP
ncbi:F-box protein At3g28330 [Arabidopsis lyrata subsp. lyrata]|uniref:F-box protein At3g28330 n=1 Tax=Arabidopsis lyrata subsp. lyrata TaxID=81972 RepID=UPI000A29CD18|nr:F-box protein At3g28330 [Arabidopsis lyrata subsp. lyrata]|eukprot:XP_020887720.1 F-box protein At3g28330 [Arabidopsis lyrata subsp. lyrata]